MGKGRNHVLCVVPLTASIKGQLTAHSERSGCITGNYSTEKEKKAHLMLKYSCECYTEDFKYTDAFTSDGTDTQHRESPHGLD